MGARTSRTALALGAALVLSALAPTEPAGAESAAAPGRADCTPGTQLRGFTDDLDGTTFAGTQVAGLSALAHEGPQDVLALVDNIGTTPARFYDLRVRDDSAEVEKVTVLRRADGTPYTGADFDGEGLVLERRGRTILASSETEPSIRRFDRASGRQLAELPVPERFRTDKTVNQTFEALTLDGRDLYAGMEGPLTGETGVRILRYTDGVPVAQYGYRPDPGLGLVELAAVGDGTLLALERGFTAGVGNTVKVYRVSLTGAVDATDVPLTEFLGKRLLVDLAECPPSGATAGQPQPNPLLDNVEGMALSPDGRTLRLVSDDNGNPVQTTRLYTLRVELDEEPELRGRALIPATDYQPGPPSGAATTPANGVTPPYPGQPIPGFSAVLPDGGRLLAMPDNGFGAKTNSADFLLRIYQVDPDYRRGTVDIDGFLQLRDPDGKVPFALTRPDRLLTGADLDIESLNRGSDGTLWIGDEFGPYLINVDRTGKVLRAPVPLPDGRKSPQSPDLGSDSPTVPASRGFESMAASEDGRTLYPVLEGAVTDDADQRRRIVYEFDARRGAYTGRTWALRVDSPELVVGDAQVLDGRRLVWIERDNFGGPAAVVKRLIVTDLDAPYGDRRVAADLLHIRDPKGVSTPARPGEYGVGAAFTFPFVSVETVYPIGGGRVIMANDNNFPNDAGRIPGRPDDTELITLDIPGLRS